MYALISFTISDVYIIFWILPFISTSQTEDMLTPSLHVNNMTCVHNTQSRINKPITNIDVSKLMNVGKESLFSEIVIIKCNKNFHVT